MTLTIDDVRASVRASLAAKIDERKVHADAISAIQATCVAEKRDPSDTEAQTTAAAVTARSAADAEIDQISARLAELDAEAQRDEALSKLQSEVRATGTKPHYNAVINHGDTKEPRTYTAETNARGVSFFSDAFHRHYRSGGSEVDGRIERHASEVQVHGEMTQRATTTGSFAGLVVPQYLVDLAAPIVRAGRPVANSAQSLPLPDSGMTFQIPRGTTGASAAVQATENTSVSSTDEVWANLTLNITTVAGQADISRQSIERGAPGTDALVYLDLAGAYGVGVDQQVLSGSGSSGQVLGILNTSGITQMSAFGAAATAVSFYSKVAGAENAVETGRFLPPTAIAMHPRRWNWLLTQVDGNNRPLVVPSAQGPFNAMATTNGPQEVPSVSPVGMFQGLPVITDASIPTAVGTGPEDQVIVYRKEDLLLWEDGDGMPRELRFEQTLGDQLTIKLVSYGYIAFTAGRYPLSVALVGGNAGTLGFGLVAPTF